MIVVEMRDGEKIRVSLNEYRNIILDINAGKKFIALVSGMVVNLVDVSRVNPNYQPYAVVDGYEFVSEKEVKKFKDRGWLFIGKDENGYQVERVIIPSNKRLLK